MNNQMLQMLTSLRFHLGTDQFKQVRLCLIIAQPLFLRGIFEQRPNPLSIAINQYESGCVMLDINADDQISVQGGCQYKRPAFIEQQHFIYGYHLQITC